MFIDRVVVQVVAGTGGSGASSFRREKFGPKGGPDGGDGGKGGSVYVKTDTNLTTLLDYRYHTRWVAERGEHGKGKNMSGKSRDDVFLPVPAGTEVRDADTGEILGELIEPDQVLLVAKGGRGGRGNQHFATPTHQSPREWEPGEAGGERESRRPRQPTPPRRPRRAADTPVAARMGAGRGGRAAQARARAEAHRRRRPARRAERRQEHAAVGDLGGPAQDRRLSVHHARAPSGRRGIVGSPLVRGRRHSRHHRRRARRQGAWPALSAARRADADSGGAGADGQPRSAGDVRIIEERSGCLFRRARREAARGGAHES